MKRRIGLLIGLLLAGCSSSDPTLYTLERRPGATRAGAPSMVAVRGVTAPRYLERQGIVRREGERLVVADSDWWGETFSAMVRRVLAGDLAQRLPGANVLSSDGIAGERPDVEVELDLDRFEGEDGRVVLEGIVAVAGPRRPRTVEKVAVQVPYAGRGAGAEVDAMSDALGRAADQVAGRIGR